MKPLNIGPQVTFLLRQGKIGEEIARELGISPSTVSYHAKKIGLGRTRNKHNWNAIRKFYDEGHSYSECNAKFGTSLNLLWNAAKNGKITPRPTGGAARKKTLAQVISDSAGIRGSSCRQLIRRKILEENALDYHCAICGIDTWREKPLTLRLDHINGDGGNHNLENLRFICPNCDSQSDTYCSKNRGRYGKGKQ